MFQACTYVSYKFLKIKLHIFSIYLVQYIQGMLNDMNCGYERITLKIVLKFKQNTTILLYQNIYLFCDMVIGLLYNIEPWHK